MTIFAPSDLTALIGTVASTLANNIAVIIGMLAVIIGISFVLALFDEVRAERAFDERAKFWKNAVKRRRF